MRPRGRLVRSTPLYDLRSENGGRPLAFNKRGAFIGDEETAKRLCDKLGIDPLRVVGDCCSVGKGADGKWYGWSHRAIGGFGVGDVVRKGDVAAEYLRVGFAARTDADARRIAEAFARSVG